MSESTSFSFKFAVSINIQISTHFVLCRFCNRYTSACLQPRSVYLWVVQPLPVVSRRWMGWTVWPRTSRGHRILRSRPCRILRLSSSGDDYRVRSIISSRNRQSIPAPRALFDPAGADCPAFHSVHSEILALCGEFTDFPSIVGPSRQQHRHDGRPQQLRVLTRYTFRYC
jgi:hypothetical protein